MLLSSLNFMFLASYLQTYFANASLSVPSSDGALDGTTGEMDRAGTSHSPSPTKDLPPPSYIGFTTRNFFICKDREPPPPIAWLSSIHSPPTSMPPPLRRKIPPPKWRSSQICPRSYHHIQRRTTRSRRTRSTLYYSITRSDVVQDDGGQLRLKIFSIQNRSMISEGACRRSVSRFNFPS